MRRLHVAVGLALLVARGALSGGGVQLWEGAGVTPWRRCGCTAAERSPAIAAGPPPDLGPDELFAALANSSLVVLFYTDW